LSLPRSLVVVFALLFALPAVAQAARLSAGKSCYPNGDKAHLTGRGFAPDSPIQFSVNGRRLSANVTSDSQGDVSVTYTPSPTDTERKLVIRATDSEDNSGSTTIFVTHELRVTADPATSNNVRTWRAVFRLFGFGLGKGYIHYINPHGDFKKTVKLGRLRGPCGRLKSTRRRVLPFRNPQFGFWKLQFDTRRHFHSSTKRKRVIPVKVYRG
jgi:hypothetical protein